MTFIFNLFKLLVLLLLASRISFGSDGRQLVEASEPELRRLAESGDAYAQAALALAYANGDKGLSLSLFEADKWARLSAAQRHPVGKFVMGHLAMNPVLGYDSDAPGKYYLSAFGDSKGELLRMAASGDPIAAYAVGMILTSDALRPRLVPDFELAAQHHLTASRGGFLPASHQLGILKMEQNMLNERDVEGGLALLREAVAGDLPLANHYMGLAYLKGKGVKEDKGMALVYLRKAADSGHGRSMLVTAHLYAVGFATPVNLPLAKEYALRAKALKEPQADEKLLEIESLALSAVSRVPPTPSYVPEPEESSIPPAPPAPPSPPASLPSPDVNGVHSSTSLPNSGSSSILPNAPSAVQPSFLPSPAAVPSSSGFSEENPVRPAKTSDVSQALELAKRQYSGVGIPVDLVSARNNFLVAANAGNAEAARYLGIIYLRGKGVPVDRPTAATWFRRSANSGDTLAKRNLELLEQLLSP